MPTFKLIRGNNHAEGGPDGKGNRHTVYHRGETFISPHDLDKMFNTSISKKFERISDDDLQELCKKDTAIDLPPVQDGLEDLTVVKLRELAANEEIDLEGLSTKAEIIQAVRKVMV